MGEVAKAKLFNEARIKAVTSAKEKAQSLANAAGITLGKIINVSENENFVPRPIEFMAKNDLVGLGGDQTQPNITPGQTEIVLSVSISYEIR